MKPKQRNFCRGFVCREKPAFPICMDILKYVLVQARDWCAGFLVRF